MPAVPGQQVVDAVDGSDCDVKRICSGLPRDGPIADQVLGDGDCATSSEITRSNRPERSSHHSRVSS